MPTMESIDLTTPTSVVDLSSLQSRAPTFQRRCRGENVEAAVRATTNWLAAMRGLALGEGGTDSGFVFTTPVGTPLDHRNVLRHYVGHLKRLALPPQRFHDARHACATFLLSQGVELRVIQEILGHSQIGITANLYAHVMPTLQKDAMDHIDRAFGGFPG